MDSLHPSFSHKRISLIPAGILLITSSFLGDYILLDDAHLWSHAASHAYALFGFLLIDAVLIAVMTFKVESGLRLVSLWGALQAIVMLADILTAPQFQFTYLQFAEDLYGYWAFDSLLVTRILQAVYPALATRFHFSAPLLKRS